MKIHKEAKTVPVDTSIQQALNESTESVCLTQEVSRMPCSDSDFLKVLYTANGLSLDLLKLAIKDMPCKMAFYVYVVLLALALCEDRKIQSVSVAQHVIAQELKVNTRTVKRAMAFLRREGYLSITNVPPQKGGYQCNHIEVRFPEPLVQRLFTQMGLVPKEL
jgi:hypothetical protein